MRWFYSFRFKLGIWLLTGIMLPFIALGYISYNSIRQNTINSSVSGMQLNLDNTVEYTDGLLRSVRMSYSSLIASDEFISEFTQIKVLNTNSTFSDSLISNQFGYRLLVAASANSFIDYIDVYNLKTGGVCSSNSVRIEQLQRESFPYNEPSQVPIGVWLVNAEPGAPGRLSFVAPVFRFFEHQTLGYIRLTLKDNGIDQLLIKSNLTSECRILCIDDHERTVSSVGSVLALDDNALIIKSLERSERSFVLKDQGEDLLVVQSSSDNSNWRFLSAAPLERIIQSANDTLNMLIILYAAIILIALLIMALISSAFYKPIRALSVKMQEFERGEFSSRIEHTRRDEVGLIYNRYNDMVRRIDALVHDVYQQTEMRKDAIIAMLQTQINQHFLYNTLESIALLADSEGSHTANRMILSLSKFYRLSLANGKDQIPVSDLVTMLKHYTDIILFRHKDRMKITYLCDDRILNKPVLKYIFQPVVENAIIHGVEHRVRGGHVHIEFVKVGTKVAFRCTDNGPGIPPERLRLIEQTIHSNEIEQTGMFAISCINYQMRQYYQEGYVFRITSKVGVGTTVYIEIPFEADGEEEIYCDYV